MILGLVSIHQGIKKKLNVTKNCIDTPLSLRWCYPDQVQRFSSQPAIAGTPGGTLRSLYLAHYFEKNFT